MCRTREKNARDLAYEAQQAEWATERQQFISQLEAITYELATAVETQMGHLKFNRVRTFVRLSREFSLLVAKIQDDESRL